MFDSDSLFLLVFIVDCGSGNSNSLLLVSSPMIDVLFLTVVFQKFIVFMFAAQLELIMIMVVLLYISLSVMIKYCHFFDLDLNLYLDFDCSAAGLKKYSCAYLS